MKKLCLLGASGSIGTQTLEVVADNQNQFQVIAITVHNNLKKAVEIDQKFKPKYIWVKDQSSINKIKNQVQAKLVTGSKGLEKIVSLEDVDIVVTAMVGFVGLKPTIDAIKARKDIALANKETLVCAGHIIMPMAKQYGVNITPIDSEHSAIFQSLNGEDKNSINKIILTASGGSLRDKSLAEIKTISKEEVLNHPNWSMGSKITVDSATMFNKGLEVIEARWLFDITIDQIEVLIHRESIVHSMVEFCDHSVIAQMGMPSMIVPIQYALTYPKRIATNSNLKLNLTKIKNLTFNNVDYDKFPALKLAYEVAKLEGIKPTVMNAANEVAVELFLKNIIEFKDIYPLVENITHKVKQIVNPDLETIFKIDNEVRETIYKQYGVTHDC